MAALKRRKEKKVNLLVRTDFEHTTLGRILNWALSAGRIIVIVTELVVILAFISRFWLDRTLTNLNEQNQARQAQIEAAASFETAFREDQKRLDVYKRLEGLKTNAQQLVLQVSTSLPADVSLTNITLAENQINLQGVALSEAGLAGFLKALEDTGRFSAINLKDLTLSFDAQLLKFTVGAALKGQNGSD